MSPLHHDLAQGFYNEGLEQLQDMSLSALRSKVKTYTRNGQNPIRGYSRKSKDEIVSEIRVLVDEYLKLHPETSKTIKGSVKRDSQDQMVDGLVSKMVTSVTVNAKKVENGNLTKALEDFQGLAKSAYGLLVNHTESKATRSSVGSAIIQRVKAQIEDSESAQTAYNLLKMQWDSVLYADRIEARQKTQNLVKTRRNAQRILTDPKPLYAWVWDVLECPDNFSWEVVSISLALATGRRMGEIHSTAQFEPVDGDEFLTVFHGQLKTKKDDPESYEIPLLAPYRLVKKGMDYLSKPIHGVDKDRSARIPNAANSEVNKAFSMQLSNAVDPTKALIFNVKAKTPESLRLRNPIALLNYPVFVKNGEDWKRVAKVDKYTYHNCRTIYANVCEVIYNVRQKGRGKMNPSVYLSTVLGHSQSERSKNDTFENYDIFDKDDLSGLDFETFTKACSEFNGVEFLDNAILEINTEEVER